MEKQTLRVSYFRKTDDLGLQECYIDLKISALINLRIFLFEKSHPH